MGARIAAFATRRPDRVLAGVAVLAIACGVVVGISEDRLTLGGAGATVSPLVVGVRSPEPISAPASRVALEVVRTRIGATPGVESVRTVSPSDRPRNARLVVRLAPGQGESAARAIRTGLDPGLLRLTFSGGAGELSDVREEAIDDLQLLLLAAPLAALLVIGGLGGRAALATLFATAAAVLGAGAACVAVSLVADLSVLCLVGAAAAGLPGGILLCGLARGGADARTVWSAAGAAALPFAALTALGVEYLAAAGAGGVIAVALAAPLAIACIAAATALWGLEEPGGSPFAWATARLERLSGWPRAALALLALLTLAVLLVLALPLAELEPTALAAPAAPAIAAPRLLGAVGAALAGVALIAWLAGRRPLGALAGSASAGLAALAAAGLCVAVFQELELDSLLDVDRLEIGVGPIAVATAAIAASSAAQAVAGQARRGAGLIAGLTSAACAASLLLSDLGFVRAFALTACAGFLLDALLVRGVLAAALRSLGSRHDG